MKGVFSSLEQSCLLLTNIFYSSLPWKLWLCHQPQNTELCFTWSLTLSQKCSNYDVILRGLSGKEIFYFFWKNCVKLCNSHEGASGILYALLTYSILHLSIIHNLFLFLFFSICVFKSWYLSPRSQCQCWYFWRKKWYVNKLLHGTAVNFKILSCSWFKNKLINSLHCILYHF